MKNLCGTAGKIKKPGKNNHRKSNQPFKPKKRENKIKQHAGPPFVV